MAVSVHLASASGNAFAYVWADEAGPGFDGPAWARALGAKGLGLALDGMFLLSRPRPGTPWAIDHWDSDGSSTFCSNGSRAALAVPGAPAGEAVQLLSNGLSLSLRRDSTGVGLRMPEGPEFGLREAGIDCPFPHAFGWIGNPQLVIEHPDVEGLDLASFAPPLRHHPALPEGANVNVLHVVEPGVARIRSWERGVEGETLCCGTGCAVAGAWLAQRSGVRRWTFQPAGPDPVTVELDGLESGAWRGLWLSGPLRYAGVLSPSFLPPQPRASR
jgi:diaminopimelate epimerase